MAPRDLVLLHGFTHTGASWEPVVAALGERYRALTPDIRGHGSASARRPVSRVGVVADLSTLILGDRPDRRVTLVGYSMGGRIALQIVRIPMLAERIERLVLISASPGIADRSEREARRAQDETLADELERSTIEEFAERWARTPVLAGQPPEVLAAAHADRLRNATSGLAAALRGLGTGALPPVWDRLPELTMPVTLVVGERDAKFRAIATEMAALIPEARVEVVPGAGHSVHLEVPRAVARILALE